MQSVTALVRENAQLERRVERIHTAQERREEYGTILAASLGARIGLKLATTFVPALAPMLPVIEIGGAALAVKKAFELGDDSGIMLGLGIGAGIGAADRFAETALGAINKFKNK